MTIAAMLIGVLSLALCIDPVEPHEPEPAFAARYGVNVMKRVAIKRGLSFRPIGEQCGMTIDWAPLGSYILVTGVRTGVSRVCQSVDVSQSRHVNGRESDLERHIRTRLVELDSRSALAICGKRYFKSRWKECPVMISKVPPSPNPARSPLGS